MIRGGWGPGPETIRAAKPALFRKDLEKGLDRDVREYPGGDVGIGGGPGAGGVEVGELGDDQGAGKAGGSRILAVDGRMRARQQELPRVLQSAEPVQVGRTRLEPGIEAVRFVLGDDGVIQVSRSPSGW